MQAFGQRRQSGLSLSRRRGAAAVEMALVIPIFFTVVLGIFEFGRAMMVGQLVTNAAREGAREAVLDGATNSDVEDTVKTFVQETVGVSRSQITVKITVDNPNAGDQLAQAERGDPCTVRVEVPFDEVSFAPAEYLQGENLAGESTMRHE